MVIAVITGPAIWGGPGIKPRSLGGVILAWGLLPQLCAVLVLLGASRSAAAAQATWRVLAVGISLYGIASLWTNLDLRSHHVLPVPYFTDGIWMIAYGCLFAAIVLSGRPKRVPPPLTTLIDSLLIAFGVMTLAAATVLRGLITGVGSGFWRAATALAYPLWDLALLGALAGGMAITRPRLERWRWVLLAGVLLLVTGDSGYLRYAASGQFSLDAWYWPVYLLFWLIIAFSPWVPSSPGGTTTVPARLWRQFVPGAVVVIAGGVMLAGDYQHRADSVSSVFAAIALTLVLVRTAFTFREARAHAAADARLAAIVASTEDSIVSLSLDGKITSWNAAAERIYGYSAAEAVGQPGALLLSGHQSPESGNAVSRLLAGEHVATYEVARRRKDGSSIEVATTISLISDPAGNAIGVAAISRDVTEQKRLQRELQRLADAAEHGTDAVISAGLDGRVRNWNARAERLFGFTVQEAVGTPVDKLILRSEELASVTGRVVAGEPPFQFEARHRRKDGSSVDVLVTVVPWHQGGRLIGFTAIALDLSERKRIELTREHALQELEEAQRLAKVGSFTWNATTQRATWSAQCFEIFGRDPTLGAPTIDELTAVYMSREEAERFAARLEPGRRRPAYLDNDWQITTGAGEQRVVQIVSYPDPSHPGCFVGTCQDITERKRYEARLQFLADHDQLTGLWNRHRLEAELERHVQANRRLGSNGALLILDVDDFKAINDTLGHEAGDQLIVLIAGILKQHLQTSDVLARLGGDEFAVLLESADHDAARQVAAELGAAVRTDASQLSGHSRQITCSIGVSPFEPTNGSVKRSMIEADLAMYDVKAAAAGGDGYAFYATTASRAGGTQARLKWTARIEHAIDEDGFVLVAQPILDLHSDEVHQHELLVRMRGDDGELIPPVAFLGVAERFGLIGELDAWVVEHAITLLAEHPQLQLEVNISGKSLGDQKLLSHIDWCLREHPIDPTHLIFEVTETAAVSDILHAQSFAEHLRGYGCRFALDDFGAGFGSFYYFKHLPFDYVKIDGEFVKHAATSRVDQLVVQAVVGIARGLGKETIAEFVADAATEQIVKDLAVDYAQGYHIGKPVPIEELFAGGAQTVA